MEDIMAADIAFYQQRKNLHADDQASLDAQLLLPIKCYKLCNYSSPIQKILLEKDAWKT
jgi:hypothetical protein